MATAKSFRDIFKNINKSIETSKAQAINKAVSQTKTEYARTISEELGITQTKAKKRVRIAKATTKNLGSVMSIGVREKFPAHEFKPKRVTVNSAKGKRYGATYTVKSQGTTLAPGGFLMKSKKSGKNIILQRTTAERYPITTVKTDVFRQTVERVKSDLSKFMRDKVLSIFNSQLKYNLTKK